MPTENPNTTPTLLNDGPAAGRRIARHGESISLSIAGYLAATARIIAPIVTAAVVFAVILNAGAAIARLFARMGADWPTQALAAAASVGVLLALAGILTLSRSANMRALAIVYAIAWLPLTLALVGFEAALSSELVFVPDFLTAAGRTIAALLAGLALLPAITIAIASARADGGDVRAALAYYTGNALKLVLLVATSGANLAFGLARGVPLEVSLFVAVVLETGLILSLLRAHEHHLHAGALVVFGSAVGLVAVETLSVLSGLSRLPWLASIGEALYLLTPALAIAYIVAAQLVQQQPASTRAVQPGQPQPDQVDADQVADQVDADQEPAYSLNGHGPK
jgi:hypothetical protein